MNKHLINATAMALLACIGSVGVANAQDAAGDPLCNDYGAGFVRFPGSQTCLKFSGLVRLQANFGPDIKGSSDWNNTARGQFNIDARTDTEFGTLRG